MYDLIIIGAGPAGITASVYAARKKMNFLVLTLGIGGQTVWSGDVENYTGYQFITGVELASKFEEHMRRYTIALHENEGVVSLDKHGDVITVETKKAAYEARTAIIASGKRSKELNVPGEQEYKNKGLVYCATCDGPLFANKDVAVIGGGNSALDAALQLTRIAKRVYVVNCTASLGGDAVMREKVERAGNVTLFNNADVKAVLGQQLVTGLAILYEGKEKQFAVQGIFVEIGLVPNSDFVKGVAKNELNEIVVDCANQTDVPGIFAAGDVTNVPEKQIIIAAGEGAKAVLGAFRYLAQHSF